jgi:transcriptional regulator with XRE-family HTH domain
MKTKPYGTLRNQISPERRQAIAARVKAELIAMTLRELRQSQAVTQQELAERLEITQPALSKLENQGDLHLSTLYRVIESLGGELKLVISFPGQKDVVLGQNLSGQPSEVLEES